HFYNLTVSVSCRSLRFIDRKKQYVNGNLVSEKIQAYKQHTLANTPSHISSKVLQNNRQNISSVAYKLELPPGTKVNNDFHVSLLKKRHGDISQYRHIFPAMSHRSEESVRNH
ncbi:hypothetical protein V8G54_025443, partial [Vigna mungo]